MTSFGDLTIVGRNILEKCFVLIPILILLAGMIAWLSYGIDLPYLDDWRAYATGKSNSLDITYLFSPSNDTLYPVGKVLDALAQRFLDGNSVAYQFLTMSIVLSSLLGLQWWLLSLAFRDRLLAASAFSFTIFMLQPGSYWGLQNIAYHQAIPLVCLLSILALILGSGRSRLWHVLAVAVLGTIAGLSYISGACAAVVTAVVLLGFAAVMTREDRQSLVRGGTALLAIGVVTVALQFRVILVVQGGQTHRPDAPWALPTESDFWLYLLGKIARAASLHVFSAHASLLLTLLLIATVVAILGALLWRMRAAQARRLCNVRPTIIFVTLAAVISVYLFMVAAGRANLHGPEVDTPIKMFTLGFARFHFFWVTLFLPWVAAGLLSLACQSGATATTSRATFLAVALPLAAIPVVGRAGTFHQFDHYKALALWRVQTQTKCLQDELRRGGAIRCPQLYPADLADAYAHALAIGASFTRIFRLPAVRVGADAPPPLFQLSTALNGSWRTQNIGEIERVGAGLKMEPSGDPMIYFRTGAIALVKKCILLEIGVLSATRATDFVQLFYRIRGQPHFSQANSSVALVQPSPDGSFKETNFQVISPVGFEDDFRLDPVVDKQSVTVKEIELRCRLSASN